MHQSNRGLIEDNKNNKLVPQNNVLTVVGVKTRLWRPTQAMLRRNEGPRMLQSSVLVVVDAKKPVCSIVRFLCKNIYRHAVENMTQKAQLQEVELERTSKQLKEAIAIQQSEETAKCKAAKELIKSLTAQVETLTPLPNFRNYILMIARSSHS
ncbi:hypothetical protein JHK82_022402 [Glycine max]|nr:hypothetical protein JHK85_022885 [Glycine max]KAG5137671.1 hypothetical protein JHK82_022402 [Glycine max]